MGLPHRLAAILASFAAGAGVANADCPSQYRAREMSMADLTAQLYGPEYKYVDRTGLYTFIMVPTEPDGRTLLEIRAPGGDFRVDAAEIEFRFLEREPSTISGWPPARLEVAVDPCTGKALGVRIDPRREHLHPIPASTDPASIYPPLRF